MTGTALDAPPTPDPVVEARPVAAAVSSIAPRWLRNPVVAAIVLLAIYFGMSLAFNDARGTLGTDTGGKLATLHMMERNGGLDPDLGYWAQSRDPQGVLQPLHYTYRVGDKWVNVTTLPMLYAAYPLYLVGRRSGGAAAADARRGAVRARGGRAGTSARWR